jgi:seryl-tRNA synthetase
VAALREGNDEQQAFLATLVEHGLLIPSGVHGVYGRGAAFEAVRMGLEGLITRSSTADAAEQLRFPPVLPRKQLEATGYLRSFPHLAGTIFAFEGTEGDALEMADAASRHEDWSGHVHQSDLVLTPAACYPVYPAVARRGPLPEGGVTVDVGGAYVFRHEPSTDPARLQMFHMRELIRLGPPEAVAAWRDGWRDRAVELLRSLGLAAEFDVAADPFFGRGGKMMARSQRAQELKFEILATIAGPEPTAIASFNYHQDHFSSKYGLEMHDGGTAHTACLGFGLERVTLALLATHGLELGAWPEEVRGLLGGL